MRSAIIPSNHDSSDVDIASERLRGLIFSALALECDAYFAKFAPEDAGSTEVTAGARELLVELNVISNVLGTAFTNCMPKSFDTHIRKNEPPFVPSQQGGSPKAGDDDVVMGDGGSGEPPAKRRRCDTTNASASSGEAGGRVAG